LILPGGVDVHTHFDLPMFDTVSSDDHYSGHKAAAFGGTTTVIDFVSFDKPTIAESVEAWHKKADDKAAIDFSFHMNISRFDEKISREFPKLRDFGINSIKVFMAYTNRLRIDDGQIFKAMLSAKENGLLTLVHAENGDLIDTLVADALKKNQFEPIWHARTRPALGEIESVYRVIKIAQMAEVPLYLVHMNTAGGIENIKHARNAGLPIMGETCPQYLFFTEEDLKREDGSKWICSPPLRKQNDNEDLWKGIIDNSLQVIATDHCPFFFDGTKPIEYEGEMVAIAGKELGSGNFTKIPNGLPGVGDRIQIMWQKGVVEKRISPNRFVQLNSTNPAKIFGLYPQKGSLMPGADADLVILDPEKELIYGKSVSRHRTDYNLYEGWKVKGAIEKVILRGKVIVDGNQWYGRKGTGKYIFRGDVSVI
jgi:dihydropyrimidinase